MAFQSVVYPAMGAGVVGEVFDNGPRRAESYILTSADVTYNVVGRGFSVTSQGVAAAGNAGGTKIFAGILINPKSYPLIGTVGGGPLAPTLVVPQYTQGELCTEGVIWVTFAAGAAIGDLVVYDNTTGILATIAPGADLPVGKSSAHAQVEYLTSTGAGLALIRLMYAPPVPVLA